MSFKTFVTILIAVHGLVHLIGFLRAFNLMEGKNYHVPVSRLLGLAWLLAFFLFEAMAYLLLIGNNNWWIMGIAAIILSQLLIIRHWKDAMFGTIPNIVIIYAIIIDFGIRQLISQTPA
jgi:hypothetical protein